MSIRIEILTNGKTEKTRELSCQGCAAIVSETLKKHKNVKITIRQGKLYQWKIGITQEKI